jgi:glutathione S-transferase
MAPVLGYWDIRGLVEPIRYLLHYVGAEFEDKRYNIGAAPEYDRSEWLNEKPTLGLDFPNLPYYIDGDIKLTQSTAILRHLGRKNNLVGKTEEEQIRSEVAEQQAVDIRQSLVKVAYNTAEYATLREELLKTLPDTLQLVAKFLGTNQYVLGENVSYVDFLLYDTLDFVRLFEPTLYEAVPVLSEYLTRFEALPAIDTYLKSGQFKRLPIFGPMAAFGGKSE